MFVWRCLIEPTLFMSYFVVIWTFANLERWQNESAEDDDTSQRASLLSDHSFSRQFKNQSISQGVNVNSSIDRDCGDQAPEHGLLDYIRYHK